MADPREAVITGIGLVSSLGEGVATHLDALKGNAAPIVDTTTFAPFPVHAAARLEWEREIAKKADQRQMEPWQKLGVYAAGLALGEARLKGDKELLGRLNVIVAAGGGERDYAVDGQILSGLATASDPGAFLNERLMSDIRPTLFLAQLSNLLAGNISIVHGVTGPTRTFMGEEQAGVDALRIAAARIAARQGDLFLVGGSYNGERADLLLLYELGGVLWKAPFASVWDRAEHGGGFILGSGGAFLVLEALEHAERRGIEPIATVRGVAADRTRRIPQSVVRSLDQLWDETAAPSAVKGAVFSGATGLAGITEEERSVIAARAPGAAVHALGDLVGHMMEAQFLAGVALAAAALKQGLYEEAIATSVGHVRGEGLATLGRTV